MERPIDLVYREYGINDPAVLADWSRVAMMLLPHEPSPLFVNVDTIPELLLRHLLKVCEPRGSA